MKHLVLLLVLAVACSASAQDPKAAELPKTIGRLERYDLAIDKLVSSDAKIEVLGGGYDWSEGVVWVPAPPPRADSKEAPESGYALFSDIPPNKIFKWQPGKGVSVFKEKVGYTGPEPPPMKEPGTNGLALDSQGRLVMCCHGDRCIKRIEKDGKIVTIADKFEGKRFNSPNDLVYAANGDLYFTDPPYGLQEQEKDKGRELDWFGVYRLSRDGKVTLLTKEMTRPNGIGLSPDEKTVYVAQSDPKAPLWKAFPIKPDGSFGESRTVLDASEWAKRGDKGLPDGLDIDATGNLWATAPGGVAIFTPEGKVLGRLNTGEATANCKFGNDKRTLFICADMYFCKIRTLTKGK